MAFELHQADEDERGMSPTYGDAYPISPPSQSMRVPLPTDEPRAVWVLLAINIVIYVLTVFLSLLLIQGPTNVFTPSPSILNLGWKRNDLIVQGEYWRLLTAMFLHGNLLHILFNGYALYILGPQAERIYGSLRFLTLYVLAGLSGSIASYAFSRNPSVGASGAIFGLVGGLGVFFYLGRTILGDTGRSQLQGMITIVMINLIIGFTAGGGIIDNYAHIGGLIGGMLAGWMLAPRYTIDRRLYPPVVVRQFLSLSWVGAGGMLLLLILLVLIIRPPL